MTALQIVGIAPAGLLLGTGYRYRIVLGSAENQAVSALLEAYACGSLTRHHSFGRLQHGYGAAAPPGPR
jgi:hypothetical protein